VKINGRVPGIVWRRVLLVLALKALQAGPGFDERPVYGEVLIAGEVLLS
jgi:hypothetical protein